MLHGIDSRDQAPEISGGCAEFSTDSLQRALFLRLTMCARLFYCCPDLPLMTMMVTGRPGRIGADRAGGMHGARYCAGGYTIQPYRMKHRVFDGCLH